MMDSGGQHSALKPPLGATAQGRHWRAYHVWFALIILTALFLRLYNLEFMEFKGDEALNSFKALGLAQGLHIPLTSAISSTGIHEPPIFMYILAIPLLVTPNPVFAAAFIALLNVLGIVFCYLLVRRFYSERAALIAAALYAVNPWQVLFSRKIWTQDLLAPFVMLLAYLFFSVVLENKKRHLVYLFMALGVVLQIHLSSAYLAVFVCALVLLRWKHLSKRELMLGIILMALSFGPYFIFQIKNNFVDLYTFLGLIQTKSPFQIAAFITPFKLLTTNGFEYSLGRDLPLFESDLIKLEALDMLAMAILFLSSIFLFIRRTPQNKLLAAWLLLGIAFMAFNKTVLMDHYFNSIHPILIITIAIALDHFLSKSPKYLRYCTNFLLIALIAYQFMFSLHFINFIKGKDCIHGDYGPPFAYRVESVRQALKELGPPKSDEELREINRASDYCVKCDFLAAKYIVENLLEK